MLVKFLIVIALIPWSLLGLIALSVFQSLRRKATPAPPVPQTYEESKQGIKLVSADYIAKIGRA